MRYAVVAAAFVAGVAAVPFERGPGRPGAPQGGRWGPPPAETDTDCEVEWVTVDESASSTVAMATPSSSDVEVDPVASSTSMAMASSSDVEVSPVAETTHKHKHHPHRPHHGRPTGGRPTHQPETTTGWSTTLQTSKSKPAAPPSSYSSVVVPSTTAESSPTTSAESQPTTTAAGETPFPYPSGVINLDGYDYSYSAPTQFTWTGDLNTEEHMTVYTNTDGNGMVTTTSTTELACSTAAPEFVQAALDGHNTARAEHSANPVIWDDSLACIAQRQAQSCIWEHLTYVDGGGYGQNLGGGADINGSISMWYGEGSQYDSYYGDENPPDGVWENVGHFTQMVWAYTTSIGCATYDCGSGTGAANSATGDLTVCNYFAGGNMGGFYGVYVLPKAGSGSDSGSW